MGNCATGNVNTLSISGPATIMKPRPSYPLKSDSHWLNLQFKDKECSKIMKPNELESNLEHPPESIDENLLNNVLGSLIGLAIGDALGAHVEFRPHQYLIEHPVNDFQEGGTWNLGKGQFTDDTSMALCLAISLIVRHDFSAYDQLVRYKWWFRYGYMSSTGNCFDIGAATSQSLREFERRQNKFAAQHNIRYDEIDTFSDQAKLDSFDVYCSDDEAAGNGGLMRLAPVPLFFHRNPIKAVGYSGTSARITHGDHRAYDASRFYGALIVAALKGEKKEEILDEHFYEKHKEWFGNKPLHQDIYKIAQGSYKTKKNGYDDGIRGKGFVVNSLEAALWAFFFDENSFEKGVLLAVNLGDDTDTTAAIYGQLAGAYYGYKRLPSKWTKHVYAQKFIKCLSEWIVYEGHLWFEKNSLPATNFNSSAQHSTNNACVSTPSSIKLQNKNSAEENVENKKRFRK